MFSLTGTSSILSHDLIQPLDVSSGLWEIGLIELNTYNSIPNIEKDKNDRFYYTDGVIVIPEGAYEIEDIKTIIQLKLPAGITFSLKPNNSTLKCDLMCSLDVDFTKIYSLAQTLGFRENIYKANVIHTACSTINIMKVETIRVECNVARGSYLNGIEGHVIHELYPSMSSGYKILELPRNFIYLPVISQMINNLTISLKDQNGDLVNFRNELITVRLHLRHGSSI